ncbi:hypothetical protein RAAC3_TM7C00001G0498 [Candidatus Saccharibacteria bacterium RAAC3_TM7_1]|nr:hypothetical protein RAAC3_TM7C00001G0498 [Candidatus Saccharibacteria bacterium RAAC3_TM7_1]HCZ28130.1 hypothetical protein [Candidatus Saccharibacteria bacterium]
MSERLANTPEHSHDNPELKRVGEERRAELARERLERSREATSQRDMEQLREAAEKAAEVHTNRKKEKEASPAERRKDAPLQRNSAAQKAAYARTMRETRAHMSVPGRAFSNVIHNKIIEKTSDAVGSTVARPNAMLSGAVSAFIVTLVIYLIARYYGYPLSGFESIGSFIVGWLLGLLFDYFRVMITGKKP